MPDKLLKYMQLTKVDPVKNLLYGVFTAEVLDKSNEVADYDTTKAAFKAFSDEFVKVSGGKSLGNVRKMHTAEIAGGIKSIDYDDLNKMISGCVEVTPEIAAQAQKGWLNGFSIGGGYAKRWPDPVHKNARRFTPIIAEVSVVDNPCVPDATFDAIKDASFAIIKADGTEELRKYALKPQDDIKTVYQAKDGSLHETEDLAKAKNTELSAAVKVPDPIEDKLQALEKLGVAAEKKGAPKLAKKISDIFDLKKGLYDVARIAGIIEELGWVAECLAAEAFYEGDGSKNPDKLKDVIKRLSAFLMGLVKEELAEATKAAPEFTASDVEILRKVSGNAELFKDWKAADPVPDPALLAKDAELKKVAEERDEMKKVINAIPARLDAAMESIGKRLKAIEEQPAAGAGPLFAVEKEKGIGDVTPISRSVSPAEMTKRL